jgi:hypothetical protein
MGKFLDEEAHYNRENLSFVEGIKVKTTMASKKSVTKTDVNALIAAWDIYAEENNLESIHNASLKFPSRTKEQWDRFPIKINGVVVRPPTAKDTTCQIRMKNEKKAWLRYHTTIFDSAPGASSSSSSKGSSSLSANQTLPPSNVIAVVISNMLPSDNPVLPPPTNSPKEASTQPTGMTHCIELKRNLPDSLTPTAATETAALSNKAKILPPDPITSPRLPPSSSLLPSGTSKRLPESGNAGPSKKPKLTPPPRSATAGDTFNLSSRAPAPDLDELTDDSVWEYFLDRISDHHSQWRPFCDGGLRPSLIPVPKDDDANEKAKFIIELEEATSFGDDWNSVKWEQWKGLIELYFGI